jgi:hypothetical protein
MFGKLWQWAEDAMYAALTRGAQRFVNDMSAPAEEADRPVLQLVFRQPEAKEEAPSRKARKAE